MYVYMIYVYVFVCIKACTHIYAYIQICDSIKKKEAMNLKERKGNMGGFGGVERKG